MTTRHVLVLALAAALAACTSLLPRGSTDTPSTFADFATARSSAEQVVAYRTRTSELKGLGFDPISGHNVTLIPYPEIVGRLAPYSGMPVDELDPGIRECIQVRSACRGYLFHFERQDRQREGSFWLDFLNVRRNTTITGWWLDALIVVADEKVLFRNYAGQERTNRVDKQVNPLGPFQPAGEGAATVLIH